MTRSFEGTGKEKDSKNADNAIDFLEKLRQKRMRDGVPNANPITHAERDPSILWDVAKEIIGDMETYIKMRPELGVSGNEVMKKRDELLREAASKGDRSMLEDQIRAVIKKYEERSSVDREVIVARLALARAYTWEDDP